LIALACAQATLFSWEVPGASNPEGRGSARSRTGISNVVLAASTDYRGVAPKGRLSQIAISDLSLLRRPPDQDWRYRPGHRLR